MTLFSFKQGIFLCVLLAAGIVVMHSWYRAHKSGKTIYIIPFAGFEKEGALFNLQERDDSLKVFHDLKKALEKDGHALKTTALTHEVYDADCIVAFNVPCNAKALSLLQAYKDRSVLFVWEPPVTYPLNYQAAYHRLFSKIVTWQDNLIDNRRYFKFCYPQPHLHVVHKPLSFEDKKLCTLIATSNCSHHPYELYSKRFDAVSFFEQYAPDDFDLYGVGWNKHEHPTYKGMVERKTESLKLYRFCICYENTQNIPGYITEKIFDCFAAGCVPIYWGPPNVAQYIPQDCFIDRQAFADEKELYDAIKTMDKKTYQQYQDAIQHYLASDTVKQFSIPAFIETFKRVVGVA